jgi:hypothetical protein
MLEYKKTKTCAVSVYDTTRYVTTLSQDEVVTLLNEQQERIELLELELMISNKANSTSAEKASDARWAADAANGLLRWGQ